MSPFRFECDSKRSLLIVTKHGYWDMTIFADFAAAFRAELRAMRGRGGCGHCLIDATAFAVQSADVKDALQALVESFAPDCPARMAGVSGSKLSELQARRAGDAPNRRVFSSRADAEAWLFAPA